jgi:hypothetical protein
MADAHSPSRVRLLNCRSQPVELHLGGTVVGGGAGPPPQHDPAALLQPQLAYLVRNKALAVRDLPPPEPKTATTGTATTPRKRGQGKAVGSARSPQPPKRKKGP